jgi:hypothetical protein
MTPECKRLCREGAGGKSAVRFFHAAQRVTRLPVATTIIPPFPLM